MFLAAFWPLTAPAHTYAAFMRWFCGRRGWEKWATEWASAELDENLKMPGKANIFQWDFLVFFFFFWTYFFFIFFFCSNQASTFFCRFIFVCPGKNFSVGDPELGGGLRLRFCFPKASCCFSCTLLARHRKGRTHELCSCSRCGF